MQLKVVGLRFKSLLAMKLLILFTVAACLQVSARGYSQTITLSLENAPLEKVFKEIKKQTGYSFVYTRAQLKNTLPITYQVKNGVLKDVLEQCFRNQPLSFVIDGRYIVVQTKAAIVQTHTPVNPPINISGKVINEKGEPVEGVSVLIKGTQKGTTTNSDGFFELKDIDENGTLIITGVNIQTTEIKIAGKADVLISVKTKIIAGDEVIVSTGYQVIHKERATGSFAAVNKEQFDNRVATDVISRLEGITSSLVFNKQGLLGTPELSIRGRSTIFANDQPLIVVDNFPYDGDIAHINPNDVENITVLKDAAAASIWGVRAGNGVIVITTKKGRFNQPLKVQLNNNITIGSKPDLFYSPNFLNTSDFIDLEKYLFSNGYYDADLNSLNFQPVSPVVDILAKQRAGLINAQEANAQIDVLKSLDVRNDISRYLFRKSVNWQNSLSITGGKDRVSYFFSIGYDKNKPGAIQSDYDRLTLITKNLFSLTKNLTVEIGVNYVQSTSKQNTNGTDINTGGPNNKNIYPYAQLSDNNGHALSIVKDYRKAFVQAAEANGFLNWQYFPLTDIGLQRKKTEMFDTRINAAVRYNFLKGLSGELKYQYQRFLTQTHDLDQQESYYVRNLINQYASVNSSGVVTKLNNVPLGDILDLSNADQRSNNMRGQLNFNKYWNNNNIDAIAGVEVREIVRNTDGNRLYGYNDDLSTYQVVEQPTTFFTVYPSGNSGIIQQGPGVTGGTDRFRSYFANVAYTYKDRYTLSASGRIDQSNFFGVKTNQRAVPLWSAGAKWIVSKENFYHIEWLPELAFRATYGYNGNLDRTVTAITTFSYFSTGAPQTGARYAEISNIGNPELRWEKTRMFNLGFDFVLKKDALSGSVEYFQKNGIDLMGDAPLAPSSGVAQLRGNFANMRGNGIDVQLVSNIFNRDFKWQTFLLFSYATDKVTKYDIKFSPETYFAANGNNFNKYPIAGYPLYSVFSMPWGGLDPLTGDPRGYNTDTLTKDYSLLTSPSLKNIIYNGPARPTYSGGLTNTLSFKGFLFSFNISYKLGYYFRRTSVNYNDLFLRWIGNNDYSKRWQNPGDESKTNVPSLGYPIDPKRDLFYSNSEILVEKGDHIRLQYLSIGYDLSTDVLKKVHISSIRFYFLINNIGILWRANKYKIDPDFPAPAFGNGNVGIPLLRTVSAGLKVNF